MSAAGGIAVRVRYLSAVRDQAGARSDEVSLPGDSTLADLSAWISTHRRIRVPAPSVMSTLNGHGWSQLPAGLQTVLRDGDEVALFPLLSGG